MKCHFCCFFFFKFYFTHLVVLNSTQIKHFNSCLCDPFESVKQAIKNINHSCFAVPSLAQCFKYLVQNSF